MNEKQPEVAEVSKSHNETEPVAENVEAKKNEQIIHSEEYTHALHSAHYPAMGLSLLVAILGIFTAYLFYIKKVVNLDAFVEKIKPLYNFSLNKWYFDEFYNSVFVGFVMLLSKILNWFDANIVDGIVNASASVTRTVSTFSNAIDKYIVDGLVNFLAILTGMFGIFLRKLQTGKVQTYLVMVIFSIIVLIFIFI